MPRRTINSPITAAIISVAASEQNETQASFEKARRLLGGPSFFYPRMNSHLPADNAIISSFKTSCPAPLRNYRKIKSTANNS